MPLVDALFHRYMLGSILSLAQMYVGTLCQASKSNKIATVCLYWELLLKGSFCEKMGTTIQRN